MRRGRRDSSREPGGPPWSSLAATALLVAVLAGCGSSPSGHSEILSQADYDGTWPFRVASGTLRCLPGKEHPPLGAIVIKVAGTSYAVNGAARDSGYRPTAPIRDESHPGLGDVIVEGGALCAPNLGPYGY